MFCVPDSPLHDADSPATSDSGPVDLGRIEADFGDVERALARLDDGTYWTCEITGAPIPDEHLAADPVSRRAPGRTS